MALGTKHDQLSNMQLDTRHRLVSVQPNAGLDEKARQGVCDLLNRLLADENILYMKTRNYHWNVVGPHFHPLHLLFEEHYQLLDTIIDEMAERVRQLGGRALGTLAEYTQFTRLAEDPGEVPPAHEMVANLVADHEAIIRQLAEGVDRTDREFHDMATNNFLAELMERHGKMAWMLRATIQPDAGTNGHDTYGGQGGKR